MDKNISDAAELLLKGAKMLAQHCTECKMPLFKYEGKVICPSCRREFEIEKNGTVKVKTGEIKDAEIKTEIKKDREFHDEDVREIIRGCIVQVIRTHLRCCEDLDVLERTVGIIEKLLDVLERLDSLRMGKLN
jgi:UPF0148 protein